MAMAEEAGMFVVHQTIGTVLCCKCGIPMQPSAANMCVNCLRSEVDITQGLRKQVIIVHCPECDSYLMPPKTWIKCRLESNELLTFCWNKVKNTDFKKNKIRGVHAEFIWTEPHSKRIKVRFTIQKEVIANAIFEQKYIVEYIQHEGMCHSCSKVQANPDQWVAVVQLRQHVSHRRTFFYLEQIILKHDAAARAINVKQMSEGIDFFFANRSHAIKFVEFVGKVAPVKSRHDKQLVSHDSKSNNYNYKYTFSVEICPISREDLICLPPKVAASLGNLGPLVICTKVTNTIALMDPLTLRHCFLDAERYWRTPFQPLLTCRQLVQYYVIDVKIVSSEVNVRGSSYTAADVEVARLADLGTVLYAKTHLGHLLKPGDYALGYDLYGANTDDAELDNYRGLNLPEAILIKKSYEETRQKKRGKPRPWKLKSLNMELDEPKSRVEQEKVNSDYEQFLKDLEENPDLRFNISLYHNGEYQPSEMGTVTDGEDVPSVPLEELLADLDLSDKEVEDYCMEE
ncbi:hypothetical protein RJ639_039864 [Escallonia herrerae]|uniref:60S ribosomal export protein NMD3 n=1 Tax=Escallonia herrerae TaxID=1293975 RepID=A0AA88WM07_9ASTE|nr:hypothetical protein RJ639_039864 [Escallonia herrerae]